MKKLSQTMVDVMKDYAKIGWPVIPCNGKIPLIEEWQKRKKVSAKEIDGWFIQWPSMNIGLVLGYNIIGVDIDGLNTEDKLVEISKGDLPDTWSFKTPSGGSRRLYAVPDGTLAKKWSLKLEGNHCGIELLGNGNQTIVPPSIIPKVGRYEWHEGKAPNEIEIANAPEWILELMVGVNKIVKKTASPHHEKKEGFSISSSPNMILQTLAFKCPVFKEALQIQKTTGLPEDEWFRWVHILCKAGYADSAKCFSELSTIKHTDRSDERIQKLEAEGTGALIRCTTFGCPIEAILSCFSHLHRNSENEVTNSPGGLILEHKSLFQPVNDEYEPYIKALARYPDFGIDDYGNLCGYDSKGERFRIANFVARPILEIIRYDGVIEDKTYRIEGILTGGIRLKPKDIKMDEFLMMSWVIKEWGIEAIIRSGFGKKDLCREAIQNMGKDIKHVTIFTHMGFEKLESGKWVFLHSNGCIGAEDVTVEIDQGLERYCMPKEVLDPYMAGRTSLDLLGLAPHKVMVPLLALIYLSPLVEAFTTNGHVPNFLVWLYGSSGTRKTSLAMVLLSHFGYFPLTSPPASFKDTASALEKKAFATKDVLLLVDDYHPQATQNDAQHISQVAQKLLRSYGDRIGRGRCKGDMNFQQSYPPRGMCMVTGEDLPSGHSTLARLIGIELKRNDVDLQKLSEAQSTRALLSESMFSYIQWITNNMDVVTTDVEKDFLEWRTQFQKRDDHGRLGESAAWLYAGYIQMLNFMIRANVCSDEDAENLLMEAETIFSDMVSSQAGLLHEEKPVEQFLRILQELLLTKKAKVVPLKGNTNDQLFGDIIGWEDNDFFYLYAESAYKSVEAFLTARHQSLALTPIVLWKHLDEAGVILSEVNNKGQKEYCRKIYVPMEGQAKKRIRLLHLRKSVLNMILANE